MSVRIFWEGFEEPWNLGLENGAITLYLERVSIVSKMKKKTPTSNVFGGQKMGNSPRVSIDSQTHENSSCMIHLNVVNN